MKRDDEIQQGKYEWELEYRTNERPLSDWDRRWILLVRILGAIASIAGLLKLFGVMA